MGKLSWESEKSKILRRSKISPAEKLKGLRLMNELLDKALTKKQKLLRAKLRQGKKI